MKMVIDNDYNDKAINAEDDIYLEDVNKMLDQKEEAKLDEQREEDDLDGLVGFRKQATDW